MVMPAPNANIYKSLLTNKKIMLIEMYIDRWGMNKLKYNNYRIYEL